MYDLIIVGARVAGSPTAMLAARAGYKVLLVDRCSFPSDTLSTNYIHQPGCARLARWGLLEKVANSGCPPIPRTRFEANNIVVEGGVSHKQSQINAYAPRRYILDNILMQAAKEEGVEVRENCTALAVIKDNEGRCMGVELKNAEGSRSKEYCRLLVGADGRTSKIASMVGARKTVQDPVLSCAYYSFWENLDSGYELYEGKNSWVGAVPTHDSILIATYFPQKHYPEVRQQAFNHHLDAVRQNAPSLYHRMRSAQQTGKLWGTGHQENFFRTASGPGWALVGDAGHHKDSITARGITDAFMQAELLIARITHHLHDKDDLDHALSDYARDRDILLLPGYHSTLKVAQLENQHTRNDLLRIISSDDKYTALYFDVVAGISPYSELQKIMCSRESKVNIAVRST